MFPSATHTRFEHSLGVAIKAKEMATHIWTGQRKELGLDQADINTVELAGARGLDLAFADLDDLHAALQQLC